MPEKMSVLEIIQSISYAMIIGYMVGSFTTDIYEYVREQYFRIKQRKAKLWKAS